MSAVCAIVFDVETTGNNPARDQIIELSIQCGFQPGDALQTWRVKPQIPISAGAQAVHGISMEALADCPSFSVIAPDVRKLVEAAEIIVGYNVEFDLTILQQEFQRLGERLEVQGKQIVDPLVLWRRLEPRRLTDAYRRFVGGEHDGAHGAAADVVATAKVLSGMLDAFNLPRDDWAGLAELCELKRSNWIGPSHHFQWKGEVAVFGFGKYRDRALPEIAAAQEVGYFEWLIRSDFPDHVKEIARVAPTKSADELTRWLSETFGKR